MTPYEAYYYALKNHTEPDFDLEHYQKIACKDPENAYYFAKEVPGSYIEYCQEYACKDSAWAFYFAADIFGADLAYCRKACEQSEFWLNEFDKMIIEKAML